MTEAQLDALLITSEPNYRYLTGFINQFWLSPTRPWYFVLPREGEPVAILPEVGVTNMRATSWIERLETWPSPQPDDEGVSLVVDALSRVRRRFGRVGAEIGPESRIGIPVSDFLTIREGISPLTVADASVLMNRLRLVKSSAEVARIRFICGLVSDAYDALPDKFSAGDTEASFCRKFHSDLISRGAEKAPYLIGVSGHGGYRSAIMSPTEKPLIKGDVLIIDTGSTFDGYYCDFDRNWAIGTADDTAKRAYDVVWRATEAGIKAIHAGARVSELWRAQAAVLEPAGTANVGSRMGHAIGLQLTEPPSDTVLLPGMVITIEPGLMYGNGALMLHEENLVVTEAGCELLTRRASSELPVLPL
jgi:Xaa-Pro aminopeptidase